MRKIFVPGDKVLHHIADPAQQRDFVVPAGMHRFAGPVDGAVRAAHGAGDLFGAAHHDALHQRLPADAGAEFLGRSVGLV